MESSKQRKQNEEAERLARQNERNNKIQGVKNIDFRNNTMGSKKEAELFLKNGNDTEVMHTKV